MNTVLLSVGLAAALLLQDAHAADLICAAPSASGPDVALGRISAEKPRTNFISEKAYLVPGDLVLVGIRQHGNVCVTYVAPSGRTHTGWIPEATVTTLPAVRMSNRSWLGHWARSGPDDANIEIALAPRSKLSVKGSAIWGAFDPERVKNGSIHEGDIAGVVAPVGNELSFAEGYEEEILPVDKADEYACKVWMRRIGPWLIVEDNYKCGGASVSFYGVYVRQRSR